MDTNTHGTILEWSEVEHKAGVVDNNHSADEAPA